MNWEEVKSHQLVIYSTPWCSDCRRLKKRLNEAGVKFQEINIDAAPEAAVRLREKTGRNAIPYIEIDDRVFIRGWHEEAPAKWDENIFFSEFAEATGKE